MTDSRRVLSSSGGGRGLGQPKYEGVHPNVGYSAWRVTPRPGHQEAVGQGDSSRSADG